MASLLRRDGAPLLRPADSPSTTPRKEGVVVPPAFWFPGPAPWLAPYSLLTQLGVAYRETILAHGDFQAVAPPLLAGCWVRGAVATVSAISAPIGAGGKSMTKPILTLAVMGLLCGMGIFRAVPALAQDEQEQAEPPEQEEEPEPVQPAQEDQVDPVQQQQRQKENACIMSGACTCLYGVCTENATGMRFAAPPAPKPDVWGAVAVSPSTLAYGSSWNWKNEKQAAATALKYCGARDCKVVATVADVCRRWSRARPRGFTWWAGRPGRRISPTTTPCSSASGRGGESVSSKPHSAPMASNTC